MNSNPSKAILGLSAFYHDSAAAITVDGEVLAAAHEERFTRKKHTAAFPTQAIEYCLEETGYTIDELDAVVYYDKPLLKFERLLETYYRFAPRGLPSFVKAMPVWVREKLFLKKEILERLSAIQEFDRRELRLLFSEHHLAHAASAFYVSPFQESAILTIDGVGEWATASIGYGQGKRIKILKEMNFPHSVGLLYSAFTYFLGFKVNSGEYKLMGLAPYGNPHSARTRTFIEKIESELVKINQDGSIWLNQEYFNYATGLKMIHESKWRQLFGFPAVKREEQLKQHHCDLAYAIQHITEKIVLKMARTARDITGSENIVMAGGVALNCVANGKLLDQAVFDQLFVQPAAGDAGGALGAALAVHHMYFDEDRKLEPIDGMKGAYLGPAYSDMDVARTLKRHKAVYERPDSFEKLTEYVADLIASGFVIGWFQGRMEYGPRALGNRSILADPRNTDMQKKLNLKIKFREGFRPFAPSVLEERTSDYFDLSAPSPYMLLVAPIQKSIRQEVPTEYEDLDMWSKLYRKRSEVQAITHVDFSARIQTVNKDVNPRYWMLLKKFEERTGCGLLVNTSFNVRGEPIVCTPEDAYRCFMRTEMDFLVMNDFVLRKEDQPRWKETNDWKSRFLND